MGFDRMSLALLLLVGLVRLLAGHALLTDLTSVAFFLRITQSLTRGRLAASHATPPVIPAGTETVPGESTLA
jgi:hypothetical protein